MSVESEESARIRKELEEFRVKEEKRLKRGAEADALYYKNLKKIGLRRIMVKIPDTKEHAAEIRGVALDMVSKYMG